MENDCNGDHSKVVQDRFAIEIGGRSVPGDCYCLDCEQPIAAWWNRGKPVPVEASVDEDETTF